MATPQKTFQFWPGSLELENRPAHLYIAKMLEQKLEDCHGYLAYRLTNLGRASQDEVPSFLLVTQEHGIISFDLLEERLDKVINQNDQEFWKLDDGKVILSRSLVLQIYEDEIVSRLKNDVRLYDRKSRSIKIPVKSAVLFYKNDIDSINQEPSLNEYSVDSIALSDFEKFIDSLMGAACSESELDSVISLLEGTFVYQSKIEYSEDAVQRTHDDFIRHSLKVTFKQDDSQRAISMQLPNGPQRIRGLAGTGKTIVLSLKAAITHKRFDSFKILYLFNTQSLYPQVQTLITKYYSLETKKAPDFDNCVHVLHAWGGKTRKGLYSELCSRYGLMPLTFNHVKGRSDALKAIYADLLEKAGARLEEIYDLVLIDEAQDFPEEVFEVVFKITKTIEGTKRIVWAYDEFQSLKESLIKEPADLFGKNQDGLPNIPNESLEGEYAGSIPKDFILPNCYRTPRPVLMIAHGVALGLYGTMTQMFFRRKDWEAIGYSVISPDSLLFSAGNKIELERKDESSKNILERLLKEHNRDPLSLVDCEVHKNWQEEIERVTQRIKRLIDHEKVRPEEIVVINLLQGNNKGSMFDVQADLNRAGIRSVIPGYVESADIFKPEGCITITTPFRAKGNEANIVFVINAQVVADDFTLRGRNTFFVAVTRSRGWCFISGHGAGMEKLSGEIWAIKEDFPYFKFLCPDEESVKSSRQLLGKSDRELDEIQRALNTILGLRDKALNNYVLDVITKSQQ